MSVIIQWLDGHEEFVAMLAALVCTYSAIWP